MSAAWAAVVIAAAVASAGALGFVIRMTVTWTRLESRIANNTDRIAELTGELREDRRAVSARLTWIERQIVWRLGRIPRGRDLDESEP